MVVRVSGQRLGRKARIAIRGITGPAKGEVQQIRVARRAVVKGLPAGGYSVTARIIRSRGRTAMAAASPARTRVTAHRSATVRVRYTRVSIRTDVVALGYSHACAVDTDNAAWCWGEADYGKIGDGASPEGVRPEPRPVTGGHRFASMAVGKDHTCGLDTAGRAWCWGRDNTGQIGNGARGPRRNAEPVKVAGGLRLLQVVAGTWHTCGIDRYGRAWCWGDDRYGQVGDGRPIRVVKDEPVLVSGRHTFTEIAAGASRTCGVDTRGTPWCWGAGYGAAPTRVAGDLELSRITVGGNHMCGIDTDGAGWCWGSDRLGQIGDGGATAAGKRVPAAVAGRHALAGISAGFEHTCAVDTGGAAWCWGADPFGQIGDGDSGAQADDCDSGTRNCQREPVAVTGGHTFIQVAAGGGTSCGIDADGAGWCWGADNLGQVGDGGSDIDDKPEPVAVAGGHVFHRP